MTERLYYTDCYLQEFTARVIETAGEGRRVYLDRTAFYPASGGQPFDLGTIGGVALTEVVDEETRIAHVLHAPLTAVDVACEIDWHRRLAHMQQHTGQHLLSAVLEDLYGMKTVSFHMGADYCTIDVEVASVTPEQLAAAEDRCAAIVAEARPVTIAFEDAAEGLRKASERAGSLRIVSIEGIDRSACGGTHVRTTAEIGLVLTGKTERVRQATRIEFVCGARALARARADRRRLTEISRTLGSAIEKTPEIVASLAGKVKTAEKERARLVSDLARLEGQAMYAGAMPASSGLRHGSQNGPIDDAMRARAQAFAANSKAVFLAVGGEPPAVLIATSLDSGLNAGDLVKAAIAAHGGRGGGNAALAQASAPDLATRDKLAEHIRSGTL